MNNETITVELLEEIGKLMEAAHDPLNFFDGRALIRPDGIRIVLRRRLDGNKVMESDRLFTWQTLAAIVTPSPIIQRIITMIADSKGKEGRVMWSNSSLS
jgi:hypothetical protein